MNKRPEIKDRKFISPAIEEVINNVVQVIFDKDIKQLFQNCFPNTLDTTITFSDHQEQPDTFVITGDINAMWHRDSTAQVWPYIPFANQDARLKRMLQGVVNRQVKNILLDPYANAFTDHAISSEWQDDLTEMKNGIHERKWEVDSLCYHIRLSFGLWKTTDDISIFTDNWKISAELILNTFIEQQRKSNRGNYKFGRVTAWSTDTVPGNGYGNPVKPNGLIASTFRPSDDATIYPFLIPSNYFAVVSLKQLAEILFEVYKDIALSSQCLKLANEIENAIKNSAIANHIDSSIYAYEIDGYGNKLFMDDANIPSLLSLPYLGCCDLNDVIYKNTRKFILSSNNPYYFSGLAGNGIGSPHTLIDNVWHLSIIMQALTSNNDEEILECLSLIKNSTANTGFMHESFDKDDDKKFTRSWFAWANSLFGELILKLFNEKQYLLKIGIK